MKEKITTGTNDRPKDETIAQPGKGLPDDSGSVIDVDEEAFADIREKLVEQPNSNIEDDETEAKLNDS